MNIVRGLLEAGHEVRLIVLDKICDVELFESEIKGIDIEVISNKFTSFLSFLIESVPIKLQMKDSFKVSDRVDFLVQISNRRYFHLLLGCDLVIFMNIWSAFILFFKKSMFKAPIITYLYEPFTYLPWPFRTILHNFIRTVSKFSKCVTITQAAKTALFRENRICTTVLELGTVKLPVELAKGNYVLTDTRWTKERDPFFLIEVAKLVPEVKFIVCGAFGSNELLAQFERSLSLEDLSERISIQRDINEPKLNDLYRGALCYIRWGASSKKFSEFSEKGPSFGVFQAISNGCIPVISDDLGSSSMVAELVSPFLVVSHDPSKFALIIKKLASDEKLRKELIDQVLKFRDNNTWSSYADKLLLLTTKDPLKPTITR